MLLQGRIQDFKLGGEAHLKKLRRAEEGANILGVFCVKNHYFTPKNHSFYNYGGRREKCWGISCEKSRFYAKIFFFFPILGGARARCTPPPGSAPVLCLITVIWDIRQRTKYGIPFEDHQMINLEIILA
jgi:hypothetical protein